jgi:hypothetical protein
MQQLVAVNTLTWGRQQLLVAWHGLSRQSPTLVGQRRFLLLLVTQHIPALPVTLFADMYLLLMLCICARSQSDRQSVQPPATPAAAAAVSV